MFSVIWCYDLNFDIDVICLFYYINVDISAEGQECSMEDAQVLSEEPEGSEQESGSGEAGTNMFACHVRDFFFVAGLHFVI